MLRSVAVWLQTKTPSDSTLLDDTSPVSSTGVSPACSGDELPLDEGIDRSSPQLLHYPLKIPPRTANGSVTVDHNYLHPSSANQRLQRDKRVRKFPHTIPPKPSTCAAAEDGETAAARDSNHFRSFNMAYKVCGGVLNTFYHSGYVKVCRFAGVL